MQMQRFGGTTTKKHCLDAGHSIPGIIFRKHANFKQVVPAIEACQPSKAACNGNSAFLMNNSQK